MRPWKVLLTLAALTCGLAGCFSLVDPVDEDLALPDAKASTQSLEREIIKALPSELLHEVKQKETGVFLPCSRGGGQQWAGGVTAEVEPGVDPSELIDPIERRFADDATLSVSRRVEDGDFLIDIAGDHSSFWILRYDPAQADLRIVSFSPCIYLPGDMSPGDKY